MAARKKKQAAIEEPIFTRMGERMLAGIIDARTLAAELSKLPVITAKTFVAAARDESSPLHDMFEWDDKIAGERHREDQARFWLACLHFRRVDAEEGADTPRMLYNVAGKDGRREYVHIDQVRGDHDYMVSLLGQAEAQLARMEASFSHVLIICEPVRRAREEVAERRRGFSPGDTKRPDA